MNLPIIEEEIARIKRLLMQSKTRQELMVAQTVLRGAIIDAGKDWLLSEEVQHLKEYSAVVILAREI